MSAKLHTQACPIAATTNIIGDRWTLLILREAFRGIARFGEFQKQTGVAKTILSERLARLVEWGIFETIDIADSGSRNAYRLTPKGTALARVLVAIHQWGSDHMFVKDEVPNLLVDRRTGALLPPLELRGADGQSLQVEDITFKAGPGASDATQKRLQNKAASTSL